MVSILLERNIETVIHFVPSLHVTITLKSDALTLTVNQNKGSCFGAPFEGVPSEKYSHVYVGYTFHVLSMLPAIGLSCSFADSCIAHTIH